MPVHLFLNGAPAGPFTTEQVSSLLRGGQVNLTTLYWRDGMADWLPLEQIAAEVVPHVAPAEPSSAVEEKGQPSVHTSVSHNQPAALAGFWRRLAAILLDIILLALMGHVLGVALFSFLAWLGDWGVLIGLVVFLVYFGLGESSLFGGQTLGKRLLHIRVQGRNGQCLAPWRSLVRTLLWSVPYVLNGIPLFGPNVLSLPNLILSFAVVLILISNVYLLIFNRRTRQLVHDLLTASYVMRTQPVGRVELPPVAKIHYALIGGMAGLMTGIILLATSTGLVSGYFAGLQLIQRNLQALPDVHQVSVLAGKNFTTQSTSSSVNVSVTFYHAINPRTASRDVATILLDNPDPLGNPDFIQITVGRAYNIGIASGSSSTTEKMTPAAWAERVKAGR